MGLTVKQREILERGGYSDAAIGQMTYETASATIGGILSQKTSQPAAPRPQTANSTDKDKSFKVAYAKDLAIAMIHECALLKVDFRELEVMKAITDNSISMVGAMWARL